MRRIATLITFTLLIAGCSPRLVVHKASKGLVLTGATTAGVGGYVTYMGVQALGEQSQTEDMSFSYSILHAGLGLMLLGSVIVIVGGIVGLAGEPAETPQKQTKPTGYDVIDFHLKSADIKRCDDDLASYQSISSLRVPVWDQACEMNWQLRIDGKSVGKSETPLAVSSLGAFEIGHHEVVTAPRTDGHCVEFLPVIGEEDAHNSYDSGAAFRQRVCWSDSAKSWRGVGTQRTKTSILVDEYYEGGAGVVVVLVNFEVTIISGS